MVKAGDEKVHMLCCLVQGLDGRADEQYILTHSLILSAMYAYKDSNAIPLLAKQGRVDGRPR